MNPCHAPYRQPQQTLCGQPICGRLRCEQRVYGQAVHGPSMYEASPHQLKALHHVEPQPGSMVDPISRSAAVTGAVASCLVAIPFVGGIFGIIFGLIAVRKARLGRMAVEGSAYGLRGKGAHVAGKIMGWSAFGLGVFMTNYYLLLLIVIAANS